MRISQQGLIIKETKLGEGDKILTILTPLYGKIQVSARGARSYRSKLRAGCQLFSFTDFELTRKKDRFSVTYAQPRESFYNLRSSVEGLSVAAYICDVLCEVAADSADAPQILSLALNSLLTLTKSEDYKKTKAVFELRLMSEAGFAPELTACGMCGQTEDLTAFSVYEGTALCRDCTEGSNKNALSGGTLLAMRHITESPQKRIFSFNVTGDVQRQLGSICENYLLNQVGRDFRSLKYYHDLCGV